MLFMQYNQQESNVERSTSYDGDDIKNINRTNFDEFVSEFIPASEEVFPYWNQKTALEESKKIKQAIKNRPNITKITDSLYALHYLRWVRHYNENQLLVIDSGDLMRNPGRVVAKVEDFLKLPKFLFEGDFVRKLENGEHQICFQDWRTNDYLCNNLPKTIDVSSEIDSDTMKVLRAYFKSYNKGFFNLIEEKF